GTWVVFILANMEGGNLYNSWNWTGNYLTITTATLLRYSGAANSTVTQRVISTYECPSDTPDAPLFNIQSFNYAADAGQTGIYENDGAISGYGTANTYSISAVPTYNGFPTAGAPYQDIIFGAVKLSSITDGLSNTALHSEVVQGQDNPASGSLYDLRGY